MSTIYLLFSGHSEDGMGEPKYSGKTEDKQIAKKHYEHANSSPFSNGKVMIANDKQFYRASDKDFT